MKVKVLGTGCANCRRTIALIDEVAKSKGLSIELEKVENIQDIMAYNILSTPGVVVNDQVVHAGGIPTRDKIEHWLSA